MESHFFRCLARELGSLLTGTRIEKIFCPAPGVYTFRFGAKGLRTHLVLRAARQEGALFTTRDKPPNPARPSGRAMWLRKRLSGRWLEEAVGDWPNLAIAWRLSGSDEAPGRWLLFDVREGVSLLDELPQGFGAEPAWPDLAEVLADDDIWRAYPHLSPPLRKTLAALPPDLAGYVYEDVRAGRCGSIFVYAPPEGKPGRTEALTWPLPEAVAAGRTADPCETALDAARLVGAPLAFGSVARIRGTQEPGATEAEGAGTDRVRDRAKRIRRTLRRLTRDAERLEQQLGCEEEAQALRGVLYQHESGQRLHKIDLTFPSGETRTVQLDPGLSLAENMARLFRLGAKARRGLAALAAKREGLSQELEELLSGKRDAPPPQQPRARKKPAKTKKGPAVHRFRTDDGFLLLRGKNKEANHALVGRAAPFDYWFHAQDGPGAHVILKRDHPEHEVPHRSLEQAAIIAGLKGWQANDAKARVMCALIKDVRKIKGAPPGTVHVDAIHESLLVELEPELEERLGID